MPKKTETTKKDFALFCLEIKRIQNLLGLREWRIDLFHQDADDCNDVMSRAWFMSKEQFICAIGLAVNWGGDIVTKQRIKEAAFHEMGHILLADFVRYAGLRFIPAGLIEEEEHRVIRRLEAALTGESGL